MAGSENSRKASTFAFKSYDTALCIIPPQHRCDEIDKLRSLYDKAYEKWPPHINLIYPFVKPEQLPQAKELLETHLRTAFAEESPVTATLGGAGIFKHKKDTTIFLQTNDNEENTTLFSLKLEVLRAFGQKSNPSVLHLTVGQAEDNSVSARQFLVDKVNFFPKFEFEVGSLAILVREKTVGKTDATSQMRLWGVVDLPNHGQPMDSLREFWVREKPVDAMNISEDSFQLKNTATFLSDRQTQPGATYEFNTESVKWVVSTEKTKEQSPKTLSVSSYNVLLDSEYPPSHDRDPLLVDTILRESALSDVLVLQEVSDDFLIFLLQDESVREIYPFVSHGPPSQADIGPLPSLRNIVILSKWHFDWTFIPFHRRHKGAIVASFPQVNGEGHERFTPLVVAGVHLSAGLTDGSVAAKKSQLQNVVTQLKRSYPDSPWIIAGDFNLPTSRYTIDEAVKQKDISFETSRVLESIEGYLSENGLSDTWAISKVEGLEEGARLNVDDLFEGEEGATFDARENPLAAYSSGSSEVRPQRYDRIYARHQDRMQLTSFNQFALPELVNDTVSVASDHYGVRAMFEMRADTDRQASDTLDAHPLLVPHKNASSELSRSGELTEVLSKRASLPTTVDRDRYRHAFELIKEVVIGSSEGDMSTPEVPLVFVPVGSYALNVWTQESDIDCLCIGTISSKTFFQLVRQRIRKAESKGVQLIRKVEANTGTMLELLVDGINVDLQYCPAANIVQRYAISIFRSCRPLLIIYRWSEFATLGPTDPIFNLSILSLRKLKPIRDLTYIWRTLPSMASYRTAYHFIKKWATDRGIYSAKFGYFGGIHITLMLSWVCKRLAHDTGFVSAEDIILSFFHYYANFDWANDMVYDAFFHKKKPRYHRSAREPMVILGYHAPNSNIAHTATTSGLKTLVEELKRADERLSAPEMTWEKFFDADVPAIQKFLSSFDNHVKVDIQYWGRALSRGKGLVGWIESRCINLVVEINKALPNVSGRLWPARFAADEATASDSYYHGCYLIGLSRNEDIHQSKEEKNEAKAALQKVFDRFLTQVKADDRYYDESTAWIGVSLTNSSHVKDLKPDDREWGIYMPDTDLDEEDEDDLLDSEDDVDAPQSRKLPIRSAPSKSGKPVSSNKLRPASDVLNRLRWDPNLDPSNYIVGYEDRFLGAKELSLDRWKTEQTDDEFIPQHRILYFKKKGEADAEIVWERATRVDKIFGSGIGHGS